MQLDDLDVEKHFMDIRTRQFINKYLRLDNTFDAKPSLKQVPKSPPPNQALAAATFIVLRYNLLDHLCDTLGLAPHPDAQRILPTLAPQTMPERLKKVQKILPLSS
jgi:hypothetical protein